MSSPARPVELAATLRQLRTDAGMSGHEAARRAKLSQPKISRLETGRQVPTAKEIHTLCRVYGASAELREALRATARDLKPGVAPSRIVIQHPAGMQDRIGRIEQSAELLRSFQPGMIIGLTQTAEYARAAMSGGPDPLTPAALDELVAARIARQAILDTDRRFVLIHTEGALRWHVGGPKIMARQLDHLAALTERPSLHIGVIPWDRPVNIAVTHAFHLYDARTVIIGTVAGTAFINEPTQVREYDSEFADLETVTLFGEEARDVFARLADEYRSLPARGRRPKKDPLNSRV